MKNWKEYLPAEVYGRLCACCIRLRDLQTLVNVKWLVMKHEGKEKDGFTKEDALVYILELLDSNGQNVDLTREEYDALIN